MSRVNQQLAARARDIAARAPNGSRERRGNACAAVALAATTTTTAARKVLTEECPDSAKAAALAALDQLTTEE